MVTAEAQSRQSGSSTSVSTRRSAIERLTGPNGTPSTPTSTVSSNSARETTDMSSSSAGITLQNSPQTSVQISGSNTTAAPTSTPTGISPEIDANNLDDPGDPNDPDDLDDPKDPNNRNGSSTSSSLTTMPRVTPSPTRNSTGISTSASFGNSTSSLIRSSTTRSPSMTGFNNSTGSRMTAGRARPSDGLQMANNPSSSATTVSNFAIKSSSMPTTSSGNSSMASSSPTLSSAISTIPPIPGTRRLNSSFNSIPMSALGSSTAVTAPPWFMRPHNTSTPISGIPFTASLPFSSRSTPHPTGSGASRGPSSIWPNNTSTQTIDRIPFASSGPFSLPSAPPQTGLSISTGPLSTGPPRIAPPGPGVFFEKPTTIVPKMSVVSLSQTN
ncbi:hypothetical protein F4782DRAFT_475970 [Xylaria castorea]|nr:hypothetical protein F4782DRAFT_475970 [Xylaria castorea]